MKDILDGVSGGADGLMAMLQAILIQLFLMNAPKDLKGEELDAFIKNEFMRVCDTLGVVKNCAEGMNKKMQIDEDLDIPFN